MVDVKSGDIIEDVSLDQIRKTSWYFSSRLTYWLYTQFISKPFWIETNKKKYKISWVDQDALRVSAGALLGVANAAEISAQQNYSKNMQWTKTINDLKATDVAL